METNMTLYEGFYKTTKVEKKIIEGWIWDFYPSMKRFVKASSNDLVDEILEVPLKVMQSETWETINYKIYVGITDLKQNPDTYIVESIVNYNIAIDKPKKFIFDDWIIPIDL